VSASGQLGVLASSERYKTGVTALADPSQKLQELRPVSYRLKNDPAGGVQYGLIAEEVDKVLPDLVIRYEQGRIQGVRYDELTPMLLGEVQAQQDQLQKQRNQIEEQQRQLAAQGSELEAMKRQMASVQTLTQAMQTALTEMQGKPTAVAMR